ncbi:MAG: hypothetical protein RML15_05435 [Bacteroidota bacterium]|nr:hypothetical protein [Candidatus Kapabacteria bacterium]MCS7303426.1 hypothetical protein [Candidatus Kapabacteria bacterium]MCX7937142.1 hypothetical protein [Chlorobiota bacterium]MDW8075219.1 hypothetical protein [Bacteroidota bacterium]MDW8271832.1 hypothetical protein [Bacteroidota bacterium]
MIRSIDGKSELAKLNPSDAPRVQHSQQEQTGQGVPTDRIELSDQARELLRNPELAKRQRIEAGIEAGFYNSPQVLHIVAQRLLKDLDSSAPQGS